MPFSAPRSSNAHDHEDEDAIAARRSASLAAMALVLALVVAGLFIVRALGHVVAAEDCLLAEAACPAGGVTGLD